MMKNILIVTFLLLSAVKADFVRDDTLEVVNDTTTCLMWQDDVASKTTNKTWIEAIYYCEDLSLAGFNDWRLPNRNELYSISDRSRYSSPAIKTAFSNALNSNYWSSTTIARATHMAQTISFYSGKGWLRAKSSSNIFVRCVRTGHRE